MLAKSNFTTSQSIQEVTLRVASYHPTVQWQCNVRFRDATLPWGTAVDFDPGKALVTALDIALRGPEAASRESQAFFYEKRPMAAGMMELLLDEYPDDLASGKVEFVPYKGWVIVMFPKPGRDLSFLNHKVEVRSLEFKPTTPPPPEPRRVTSGAAAAYIAAGHTVPAGGRMALNKDVLDNEYKLKKGKFPDRNIKKADLAKILDDMEAKGE